MAVVIQCNRCKNVVNDINKVRRLKIYSVKDSRGFADNTVLNNIDLCDECVDKIKEVIDIE